MKSKLLLGALLMGAVVLPSCVEDTPSAQVEAIRGAKAEQLKALAALANAQAAAATTSANAEATLKNAQAAYQNALAAQAAAETEIAKQEAAAAAERAAVELEQLKAQVELEAAQNKVDLEKAKNDLATEILKGQQDKVNNLTALMTDYTTAVGDLNTLNTQLVQTQIQLAQAEAGLVNAKAALENAVKTAQTGVANAEKAVAEQQAKVDAAQKAVDNLGSVSGEIKGLINQYNAALEVSNTTQAALDNESYNLGLAQFKISKSAANDVVAGKTVKIAQAIASFSTTANPSSFTPLTTSFTYVSYDPNATDQSVTLTSNYVSGAKVTIGNEVYTLVNTPSKSTALTYQLVEGGATLSQSYSQISAINAVNADAFKKLTADLKASMAVANNGDSAALADAKKVLNAVTKIEDARAAEAKALEARNGARQAWQDAVNAGADYNTVILPLYNAYNLANTQYNNAVRESVAIINMYSADAQGKTLDDAKADLTAAQATVTAKNNAIKVLADYQAAVTAQASAYADMLPSVNAYAKAEAQAKVDNAKAKYKSEVLAAEIGVLNGINGQDIAAATAALSAAKATLTQKNNALKSAKQNLATAEKNLADVENLANSNSGAALATQQAAIEALKASIESLNNQITSQKEIVKIAKAALDAAIQNQ